jgi:DNA-binding Lrp family transcriptional regulator
MKLTINEKKVLKHLLKNSKESDSELGKRLSLQGSSIARIRQRLIEKKIIQKYSLDLNYENIGIECYVLVFYSATSKWWNNISNEQVHKIAESPYLITVFQTNEKNMAYICLYGFRNNTAATTYFNEVQRVYNEYLIIQKMIFLSNNSIIKNDPSTLIDIVNIKLQNTLPNKKLFEKFLKN